MELGSFTAMSSVNRDQTGLGVMYTDDVFA